MMILLWLVVALGFAILEVATVSFFAVFIAVAALATAVAAAAGADVVVQGIIFAAVALLGLVGLRPPLNRYVQRRRAAGAVSGAESMIGRTAPVVDPISGAHETGHVSIGGERWPALAEDGSSVAAGSSVRIVGIRGATLVVSQVEARRKEEIK